MSNILYEVGARDRERVTRNMKLLSHYATEHIAKDKSVTTLCGKVLKDAIYNGSRELCKKCAERRYKVRKAKGRA